MAHDRQAVLSALRAQLVFLESGGYRHPSLAEWRPQFIFEDSPTCLNRDPTLPRKPCSECALAQFLPHGIEANGIPCRHIPLNEHGETVDSLYRTGTQQELESAVEKWLKATIKRLEPDETEGSQAHDKPVAHVKAKFAAPE